MCFNIHGEALVVCCMACCGWTGPENPALRSLYLGQNLVTVERADREHDLRVPAAAFTMIVRNAAVRHGKSIEFN